MLIRTIRSGFGRFLSILCIVALGVGLFTGLKCSKPALVATADRYMQTQNMYDFRLVSTLGIEDKDAEAFKNEEFTACTEGAYSVHAFADAGDGEKIYEFMSLTDEIAVPYLISGEMPSDKEECLADSAVFDESDIGKLIVVSENNDEDTLEEFSNLRFRISGIAKSPRFISRVDRSDTDLGSGKVEGFVYIQPRVFTSDVYHELLITCPMEGELYSDDYDSAAERIKPKIEELLEKRAEKRYLKLYNDAAEELRDARAELDDAKAELDDGWKDYYEGKEKAEKEIADNLKTLQAITNGLYLKEQELYSAIETANRNLAKINEALAQLPAEAEEQRAYLQAQASAVQAGIKAAYDGISQIEDGRKEVNYNWVKFYEARDEALAELKDARDELIDAGKELADGEREYKDSLKELEDLKRPDTYVLGRAENESLATFEGDIDTVSAVGDIFPVFFALLAALVCMTTMTRMVNEDRTVIGTLKAIGVPGSSVASKYLWYSGLSSFIGAVLGFFAGTACIPLVVWRVYQINYDYTALQYYFSPFYLVGSVMLCIALSLAVTLWACGKEFRGMPADLIRPKTPPAGKRILLEKIGFIWKRLGFLNKVMLRNAFRSKQRMLMMILGVSGCTALLVTGFGISDSVGDIMNYQYDEIMMYDIAISADEDKTDDLKELVPLLYNNAGNYAFAHAESVTAFSGSKEWDCDLVLTDGKDLNGLIDFHRKGTSVPYPNKGEAIISIKLADELDLKEGDSISFTAGDEENEYSLNIIGIFDNYVNHYIFTVPESVPGLENNTVFLSVKEGKSAGETAAEARGIEGVTYVSVASDEKEIMSKSMDSLDAIVYVVIICSGALAFIVIYNLTNINIMERLREIATVKVLGFTNIETSEYVLRENILLSFLGAALGLILGKYLHMYIITRIDVDALRFDLRITPLSYILSYIITVAFSVCVNYAMRIKLDRVKMAESLKSVE